MQKYCICLFNSVIGMKSFIVAAQSLEEQNSSRSATQEQCKARNRGHGDFARVSAKWRAKAESCETLKEKKPQERPAAIYKPSPSREARHSQKSPGCSVPNASPTRGYTDPEEQRPSGCGTSFSHERVLAHGTCETEILS